MYSENSRARKDVEIPWAMSNLLGNSKTYVKTDENKLFYKYTPFCNALAFHGRALLLFINNCRILANSRFTRNRTTRHPMKVLIQTKRIVFKRNVVCR